MSDDDEPQLAMETPWRRELPEVGDALRRWARARLGDGAEVGDVAEPGNGLSSETVLFTVRSGGAEERYAARLAPAADVYPVFPEYDLAAQAQCMRTVRERTGVPAPEVVQVESDPSWLGSPFLVMRRIDGVAAPDLPPYVFDGWVLEASPAERARMQTGTLEVLAALHTITPDTADLSFLARPEFGDDPLLQQLGHEHAYYEWAREGVSYPLIERTFAWLEARRPQGHDAVLNWGDARVGNILFRDFVPVAVLDWEMAAVGPREVDLAWCIFLHAFFDDLADRFGFAGIKDFMQRDDTVAEYERLAGVTVRDLEWFEVFAALRFAIVSVRTSTRNIAYGQADPPADPEDLIMFRHLLEQMLDGSYWR